MQDNTEYFRLLLRTLNFVLYFLTLCMFRMFVQLVSTLKTKYSWWDFHQFCRCWADIELMTELPKVGPVRRTCSALRLCFSDTLCRKSVNSGNLRSFGTILLWFFSFGHSGDKVLVRVSPDLLGFLFWGWIMYPNKYSWYYIQKLLRYFRLDQKQNHHHWSGFGKDHVLA